MIEALFETGHPWMSLQGSRANVRSPQDHVGVIHNSNLCTEITLNTSMEEVAVCNLASINIPTHLTADGSIDHDKLRGTVKASCGCSITSSTSITTRYRPAQLANLRHRPVGLGVMGMQDALYAKRIPFDAPEAVDFNDEIMEAVAFYAYSASSDLAAERGRYPSYQGSKWDRGLLPLDTLDLLEQERGESGPGGPQEAVSIGKVCARKSSTRACAIQTAWPSRRPRRSRTSWAARPASSRATSTFTPSRICRENLSARTISWSRN